MTYGSAISDLHEHKLKKIFSMYFWRLCMYFILFHYMLECMRVYRQWQHLWSKVVGLAFLWWIWARSCTDPRSACNSHAWFQEDTATATPWWTVSICRPKCVVIGKVSWLDLQPTCARRPLAFQRRNFWEDGRMQNEPESHFTILS